jgi:hypothetical protein
MSYIGQTLPADTFQGFTTDSFTGDGSATTFTLSKTPFNESALLVVINNVVQKPTTNFTVSGTTLTIVGTAVASGDVIYATHIGGALPIGQAASLDLNGASDQLILDADADTTISADTDDQIDFKLGGVDEMTMSSSGIVINEGSNNRDFRIETNNYTHCLFIDGGNDNVFINKSSATANWFNGNSIVPSVEIFGTANTSNRMTALTYGSEDSGAAILAMGKSRSATPDNYTIIQNNDQMGIITFQGTDGTHFLEGASIRVDVDGTPGANDMPGRIEFHTTADGADAGSERMRISSGGHVGIGAATTSNKLRLIQDQSDENCVQIEYDTSSADESVMRWFCDRAANSVWDFLQAYSNVASSSDLEFQMTSAGGMSMDGTLTQNGADYAEYFETADGNAIAIGKTVVLDNGKVRASTSSDDASAIIGVVRPKEDGKISAVLGNSGWNKWHNKYLTDDFGVYIWEDYTVKEWTETINNENGSITTKNHSYPSDFIPEGVTAPADAKELTQQRRKQNPDWNKDIEYKPRAERDEWVIIGLLGQIPINKNEKTGTNWIKMKDISDTIEEWLVR